MIALLSEMFSYTFLVRAVVVGLLVSLCAALLGVSLVLKRYSMIGDGLSHVGFGSLAVATAIHAAPLTVSIPIVVLAAFLLLRISESGKLKGDAAVALISTSSLAIGVVVISLTTGMNTDVCNYLFGSILAMNRGDVNLSIALAAVVLTLFVFFYNKIFAVTFDETFSQATGVKTGLYNVLIAFLTAITIVLGMRMMGALLISSLVIFPALTSMRVCKKFRSVTILSAIVSVVCFFIGVVISYVRATPTGASVVIVNIAAFALFCLIDYVTKKGFAMKKVAAFLSIIGLLIMGGCSATSDKAASTVPDTQVIEIKEKMFIAQTNDIYFNPDEYLGKTIKYEGIFCKLDADNGNTYYSVIRYGPGCCGVDANAGFEVTWDKPYPKPDDWVEAVGKLEQYDEDGGTYLRLELSSLKTLSKRGAETVSQ